MQIIIKQVESKREYSTFIHLPFKIHKDHSQWVPPVIMDERAFFDSKRNKSFAHCDTILLLAYRGKEAVGRIMGIIHNSYNALKNETNGRFGFLECYNDPEVARALLQAIEKWALQYGMTRMIGPYGFSDKDPQGFLIEGFEHIALIASSCNHPYMIELVEQNGYSKEVDCLAFRLPVDFEVPDSHRKIFERTLRNNNLIVIEFSKRKELVPWVPSILALMNECYADIYGFIPLDEKEKKAFADRYLPIIDPRFVKLITKNNELVAFFIALPNFSKGLQKSRGYLFPVGIFHIMQSMKRTKQLDLMLGGVKPVNQGLGLEVLMGFKMKESAQNAGFEKIEVHLILETNYKMLAEIHKLNAQPHKRFRVYQKALI